jgi:hypothetical protein
MYGKGALANQEFRHSRNESDINPDVVIPNEIGYSNTWELAGVVTSMPSMEFSLKEPPKVFSAIGISFYARSHYMDFEIIRDPNADLGARDMSPEAVLQVAGAGCQFVVDDRSVWEIIGLPAFFLRRSIR